MTVNVRIPKLCDHCPKFEPVVKTDYELMANAIPVNREVVVECRHSEECAVIYEYLRSQMRDFKTVDDTKGEEQ